MIPSNELTPSDVKITQSESANVVAMTNPMLRES
jgi:hypothetical protein